MKRIEYTKENKAFSLLKGTYVRIILRLRKSSVTSLHFVAITNNQKAASKLQILSRIQTSEADY